jgi:hypothetical protein
MCWKRAAERFHKNGTWFVPTLVVGGVGPLALANFQYGVRYLAGTDCGPGMSRLCGVTLHQELQRFVQHGLTPLQALQTATLNPAIMWHATDSLGTVVPGKLADLVLLDANPLADIHNTLTIRAVVANGRYFNRAALDRLQVRTGDTTGEFSLQSASMRSAFVRMPLPIDGPVPAAADSERLVGIAVMRQHIYFPITVHGRAGSLILDLGTRGSYLFKAGVERLGLDPHQLADSLWFGGYRVRNVQVADDEFSSSFTSEDSLPPPIGLIGSDELARYDLLLDGVTRTMRLYAPSDSSAAPTTSAWLPAGLTAADCVSMPDDSQYVHEVFFPIQINGHATVGLFDSGADKTAMNAVGARVWVMQTPSLVTLQIPRVLASNYTQPTGKKAWITLPAVPIRVGRHTLSVPIYIHQHFPIFTVRELLAYNQPQLNLGLDILRGRKMFISYRTKRVCFSDAATAPTDASGDPPVAAGAHTLLSSEVLAQMTAFWTAWTHLPVAIRDTARKHHQKVLSLIAELQTTATPSHVLHLPYHPKVVDMRAMSTAYPEVASALASAHLTADQWEEKRQALFTALLTGAVVHLQARATVVPVAQSVVAQNIAWLATHQQEMAALRATGMWFPKLDTNVGNAGHP